MANIKSSVKDILRIENRRKRNVAVRSEVRTYIRRFREAVRLDDETKKVEAYKEAQTAIDKAVTKGVLKANTGARYKSRLSALI